MIHNIGLLNIFFATQSTGVLPSSLGLQFINMAVQDICLLHDILQKGMLVSITSLDFSVIFKIVNIEIFLCSETFPTVFTVVLKQGWKMNTFNMLQ